MTRSFYRLLGLPLSACAALCLLGGCGWFHSHKPKSYDRAISDEGRDPTYHEDPERADVEVRDAR